MNDDGGRRDIKVAAIFDIETENWDTFVVGGLLMADGTYEDFVWAREEVMIDRLLDINGVVWAHSGGTFDIKWVLDHVAKRGMSARIVATGSRIVTARVGGTIFCDSAALVPISLSQLTEGQGVTKQKLELPCICEKDCGGYCSISRAMDPALLARLREYLEGDCKSLFEALYKLREFAAYNDLDLGATIGSSAWRNAQRHLGLTPAILDAGEHAFTRRGYYGGRVQLYKPGVTEHGYEYDVNSMYPWTLKTFKVPYGDYLFLYGAPARRAYENGEPGIYRAIVDVPYMHLPPLPYRFDNNTRTAYPIGNFQGVWPAPELQYAESLGVIVRIVEGMVWETERLLFTSWIDKLFDLRTHVPGGKKSPLGTFLKLYMNSLTGKFGSNPERDQFQINPEKIDVCSASNECIRGGRSDCRQCCKLHCSARCGCHAQISDYIFMRKVYRLDDCAHVEWSAYLTAQARITLNKKQREKNDGIDVVYSDTDSCFTLEPRPDNVGASLGQWEFAGEFSNFVGIAPKCYMFDRNGKTIRKAKGIKLYNARIIEVGKKYEAEGIVGFKAGAKLGKLFVKKKQGRMLSYQTGDRVPIGGGLTRPPNAEDLNG